MERRRATPVWWRPWRRRGRLKGAEIRSRRKNILVHEATEAITTLNTAVKRRSRRRGRRQRWLRWPESQSALWTMRVVVVHEGRHGAFETPLVQNQQPVEALRSNRSHKALRHAVCFGRAKRRPLANSPLAGQRRPDPSRDAATAGRPDRRAP